VRQRPSAERAASVGSWVGRNACPSLFLHGALHAPCLEAFSPPTGPSCPVPTPYPGPCTPFPPLFGSLSALSSVLSASRLHAASPRGFICSTALLLWARPRPIHPSPSLLWGHSHQAFHGYQSFLSTHPLVSACPPLFTLRALAAPSSRSFASAFAFGRLTLVCLARLATPVPSSET